MDICYPSDTDWSCMYDEETLTTMRSDPKILAKMKLAEAQAWYTLAALTAYRIGVCPTLVRPCAASCAPTGTWMAAPVSGGENVSALPLRTIGALNITPYITGGEWVNGCGCVPTSCGCGRLSEVILPGPIGDIEYVKIGAETINPTRYRVDEGNRLVSTDPTLVWPTRQDLAAAPGQPDTFIVSYYRGMAPNAFTRAAAGALAVEFYKLCMADKSCRFPRRVKEVTRGSTTYQVDVSLFADGLTRIPEADFVIRLLNPNLLKQQPRVISPESRRRGGARRQTWGAY